MFSQEIQNAVLLAVNGPSIKLSPFPVVFGPQKSYDKKTTKKGDPLMNSLNMAFQVVLPIFLLLSLGYLLRRAGLADEHTLAGCNTLVFRVFLPAVLFRNIYSADLGAAFDGRLMLYAAAATLLTFLLLVLLIPLTEKDNRKRSAMIQGVYRTNFILFSITITDALYGPGQGGVAALLVAVVIPLSNVLTVFIMEYYRSGRVKPRQLLAGMAGNPLILASLLGLLFLLTGWRLPNLLMKTLGDVGSVATPLALIVLGGAFRFQGLRGSARPLAVCLLANLVLVPLVFLPPAAALGFRGPQMAALLALFASPSSVSCYAMACEMGADGELAGRIVVLNSAASVATLFLWIFALTSLGLL